MEALGQCRHLARTAEKQQLADEIERSYGEFAEVGARLIDSKDAQTAALERFDEIVQRLEQAIEGPRTNTARLSNAEADEWLDVLAHKVEEVARKLLSAVAPKDVATTIELDGDLADIGFAAEALGKSRTLDAEWQRELTSRLGALEAAAREIDALQTRINADVERFIAVRWQLDRLLDDEVLLIVEKVLADAKSRLEERSLSVNVALAATGALIAAGAILAIVMLRSRVSQSLADFARHLKGAGGTSIEYASTRRSRDEIGLIQARFNQLARRLARAQAKLEAARGGLEVDVAERTRELSEAVRRLHGELCYREELQGELEGAKAAAEAASEAKSQFLANASHELRTPLNAIIGFSEMMVGNLIRPDDLEKYKEYGRYIRDSGTHLLGIVNDILDLARIEARRVELDESGMEVGDLIEDCLRTVAMRAAEHRVTLGRAIAADLPLLRADRRIVKQVVLNLLANAIKYTPDGGKVSMAATVNPAGGIEIAVTDTGIGIEKEHIETITEPFVQASTGHGRRFGGIGLGLSIAKAFMERHGGTLRLESEVGRGTTAVARARPRPRISARRRLRQRRHSGLPIVVPAQAGTHGAAIADRRDGYRLLPV